MIGLETAQLAHDTATQGNQVVTLIGLAVLVVSNIGIWLDRFVQISKNKAAQREAGAREAEAKAAAATGKASPGGCGDYVMAHSLMLERHDGEIKTLTSSTGRIERENREDHQKIFGKLDGLKDLIVKHRPMTGA